jgi:hypothetical protein
VANRLQELQVQIDQEVQRLLDSSSDEVLDFSRLQRFHEEQRTLFLSEITFSGVYWYDPVTYDILYFRRARVHADHGVEWYRIVRDPVLLARFESVPGFNKERWDSIPRGRIDFDFSLERLVFFNSYTDYLNIDLIEKVIDAFGLPDSPENYQHYYLAGSSHYDLNSDDPEQDSYAVIERDCTELVNLYDYLFSVD